VKSTLREKPYDIAKDRKGEKAEGGRENTLTAFSCHLCLRSNKGIEEIYCIMFLYCLCFDIDIINMKL